MDSNTIVNGLLQWLGLVILFTFHEFGHAWMAMKCGDNTARDEGRVSLNPLVHIDPIGTVLLPLVMFLMPGSGMIGWAKPVPVNPNNLNNPRRDDVLVTLAGPWMNLLIAVMLVGLARIGITFGVEQMTYYCIEVAWYSLLLFFFNLLPIPPLDGSQLVRVAVGMTYDTFAELSRYGFMALFILMQIRPVWDLLNFLTSRSLNLIANLFGLGT
jgi:Zn-dependent protease